jgi:hypothetical protein
VIVMENTDAPFHTGRNGASWYVALIGGVKRRGAWRLPADMRIVTAVGGANLDLTGAELPERATLTKFSLAGGVSLRVPAGVQVEVEGFRVFGRVRVEPGPGPATTVLKVREFSLAGGIHVQRG